MGTWGTGLYSDDLASDLRGEFRDLIGEGHATAAAVDQLTAQYESSLRDSDEAPVFWLSLADTGWRLGRLDERVLMNALRVIESGEDLTRWQVQKDRVKRAALLKKLRARLTSPQPKPKRVPKPVKSASDWTVGEIIAFRLLSGHWALMRVIGHHADRGGRSAVCELLDWTGESIPKSTVIDRLSVRRESCSRGISQFLFQEPRAKKDKSRIHRTGIISKPAQRCGGYAGFVWPYVDRQLRDIFGLK